MTSPMDGLHRGPGRLRPWVLVLTLAVSSILGASASAQETLEGTWEVRAHERDAGQERVQLNLDWSGFGENRNSGFTLSVSELEGLSVTDLAGDLADARFRLVREAGTIVFIGEIRDGRGSGSFRFTPASAYRDRMAELGYPALSTQRLFQFTVFDVSTSFVRDLRDLGYEELEEADLVRFVIHGVTGDFIRAMADLGYAAIEPDDLVRLRIHGVTPEYVREVRAALGGS